MVYKHTVELAENCL